MGAAHSLYASGYAARFVPRLQLVKVQREDMNRLVVPEAALAACGLAVNDPLYIRDSLSRSFRFTVEQSGGVCFLGAGWAELLRKIDCDYGDELLFKYKGNRTWKVRVFSRFCGCQKYPLRDEPENGSTNGESSNGGAIVNADAGGDGFPTSAGQAGGAGIIVGPGTKEEPIDLDADSDSDDVVYNAFGRVITAYMREFFDNLANTFELKLPLYYGTVDSVEHSCGFMSLSVEYGKKYVLPLLEEDGYPDEVNIFLNGGAESTRVRFVATVDGSIVLSRGWATFLRKHSIQAGAAYVLRVEWGLEEINIHVYDF